MSMKKEKETVGCRRQPEGRRGQIGLYGTAGQCAALPQRAACGCRGL